MKSLRWSWFECKSFFFIFLAQIFILNIYFALTKGLKPRFYPDSASYIDFTWSFPEIFSQIRTLGYPLILELFSAFDPNFKTVPIFQLNWHFFCVLFFAFSLYQYGVERKMMFVLATPLLYVQAIRNLHDRILTDSVSLSFVLLVFGCLLLALVNQNKIWPLAALSLSITACYLIRPFYLFLVGLIPLMTIPIFMLRFGMTKNKQVLFRLASRIVIVCLLPFMLFAGIRFFALNHFGLVSFGTDGIVGILSQFITPNDISKLPNEFQPLGNAVVDAQKKEVLTSIGLNGERIVSFQEIYSNFDYYLLDVIYPFLKKEGYSTVKKHKYLMEFTKILLPLYLREYVGYVAQATIHIFRWFPDRLMILLSAILFIGSYIIRFIFADSKKISDDSLMAFKLIFFIGISFFLASIFPMVLVQRPIFRYVIPAYLFIPSIIWGGIWMNISILSRRLS